MFSKQLTGEIICLATYEEEGRLSWALSLSKIIWVFIWILSTASLFRIVNILIGPFEAALCVVFVLIIGKLMAPGSMLLFDEIICRIFPTLRSALREGRVRIYDFRIQTRDQQIFSCLLKGDLVGGMPSPGDRLRVTGKYRRGTFMVKHGFNETTRSDLAARSIGHGWFLLISVSLLGLMVLFLNGTLDPVIFDVFRFILSQIGLGDRLY